MSDSGVSEVVTKAKLTLPIEKVQDIVRSGTDGEEKLELLLLVASQPELLRGLKEDEVLGFLRRAASKNTGKTRVQVLRAAKVI